MRKHCLQIKFQVVLEVSGIVEIFPMNFEKLKFDTVQKKSYFGLCKDQPYKKVAKSHKMLKLGKKQHHIIQF